MTTVATDGESMSSDSLETAGDVIVGRRTKKIWRLDDGRIVGAAGKVNAVHKFLEWLERDDNKPPPKDKELSVLILHEDGLLEMYDGEGILVPSETPAAIGSGYISALTAMDMGANSRQAEKMAIKRDAFSGGPIQTLSR